jgi:tight adherence protein B
MEILIGIGIFLAVVLLVQGLYWVTFIFRNPEKRRVKKQLQVLSLDEPRQNGTSIERKRILSEVPWFNNLLWKIPNIEQMESIWRQANTGQPLGVYILIGFILLFVGVWLGSTFTGGTWPLTILLALIFGSTPFFYLAIKKKRRIDKFDRQLPDALDLVARALRAGHAFSTSLRMVASEFDDPLGPEFERTMDEINFGIDSGQALRNLLSRLESPDLKFFVMSVILQKETGGNLAEILGNISRLIRERFKLHGKIRALSAEGRLSAVVLIAIPFLVAIALTFVSPQYIGILISDPIGKFLIAMALGMIILGVIVMQRMIQIKV